MSSWILALCLKAATLRVHVDATGPVAARPSLLVEAALGRAGNREIIRQGRWSNPRTARGYIRTANPLEDNAVTKLGL